MTAIQKPVSADEVREWARKRNLDVAEHGRLAAAVVDAYNKVHKRQYTPTLAQPPKFVKLSGKRTDSKGRPNHGTVTASFPEIRAWANANGYNLGTRGRVSQEVLTAFANHQLAA